MIFFGKDIVNNLVDTTPIEKLADKLEEYENDLEMIFTYFAYKSIDINYINNLLKYKVNHVAFYCMDSVFDIRSCPSCMIYSKQVSNVITYYIMIICTQRRFKKLGYATMLLDGFVKRVQDETKCTNKKVKIVLSSLDEVVSYYQKYGFEAVDCSLDNHPYLMQFETVENDKMYTIMELVIK
jgi:hypothetical protein